MKYARMFHGGFLSCGKRFQLRIHLFLLPLVAAAYFGNYLTLFLISWGSALVHELCHIAVGKRFGVSVSGITLMPFGVCAPLRTPVIKNPVHEIFMALAGPLANLGLYLLFSHLSLSVNTESLRYAAQVNLALCILNLIPCLPLDGGRILRALLTLGSDALTALRISMQLSRILAVLLLSIGIAVVLTAPFQFSLILIGVFLLGNLCGEQRTLSKQMLEELLYYKKKLEPDTLNRTVTLTASQELPARRLLRRLSYHRYCIVQVVDREQRILKTLTEGEILNALLNRSIRITLGEI